LVALAILANSAGKIGKGYITLEDVGNIAVVLDAVCAKLKDVEIKIKDYILRNVSIIRLILLF
jgi:hypothetical protein